MAGSPVVGLLAFFNVLLLFFSVAVATRTTKTKNDPRSVPRSTRIHRSQAKPREHGVSEGIAAAIFPPSRFRCFKQFARYEARLHGPHSVATLTRGQVNPALLSFRIVPPTRWLAYLLCQHSSYLCAFVLPGLVTSWYLLSQFFLLVGA